MARLKNTKTGASRSHTRAGGHQSIRPSAEILHADELDRLTRDEATHLGPAAGRLLPARS